MSNSIVATVYSGVIKDVIENVKEDFRNNGVSEEVLYELQRIWELKIKSAKVATWEAGLTGDDLNQNNQNINGSSNQIYMQQPMQPQSDPGLKYHQTHDGYESQAAASLPTRAVNMNTNHINEPGRTQLSVKNGNGNLLPQVPPPTSTYPVQCEIPNRGGTPINSQVDVDQKIYHNHQNFQTMMGQQQDEYGNPMSEKLIPRGETSRNSSPLPEFRSEPSFADNDDINSDLDDPDDDDINADSEETQNIILCLYDKVTRTKNKWKCQLKDGIMSVNGRDYLFQKGNGDFEF